MRMWRMYLVSAGAGMGGICWSRTILMGVLLRPSAIFTGLLYKIAGREVPVLAFAAIRSKLDGLAVSAMEGLVHVEQRLHVILAGGHVAQAADGIAPGLLVDDDRLAGLEPSTVTPKTICVLGVSSICMRGSSDGSVESNSNMRPSSGCALRLRREGDGELRCLGERGGGKDNQADNDENEGSGTTLPAGFIHRFA